ncbi:unnamed protein product [Linum trigynum]|uniref:Homeobox domain-containing protein n=1 Tax=Linum trigynum TaxID=586398 RepID=A0AAV2FTK3_9ROSI
MCVTVVGEEPKPRWNPKPKQIIILESIYNSEMVNPPRDEIRKIRLQLQAFGQVGDANVFYWFQPQPPNPISLLQTTLHCHRSNDRTIEKLVSTGWASRFGDLAKEEASET